MRLKYFLLTLISTSAFACPNLAGLHVNCIQSDGSRIKVRIVQKDNTYKVDWSGQRTEIYIADGATRETQIFDTGMLLKKMSVCEGEMLKHHAVMLGSAGDVRLDITQEYTLDHGKLHFRAVDEKGVYNEISCR